MPQSSEPCPSDDELVELAEGRLDATALGRLKEHVTGCRECAGVVVELGLKEAGAKAARTDVDWARVAIAEESTEEHERIRTAPVPVGSRIAGRFVIVSRAGAGGMGTVYQARDERTGDTVALKLLQRSEGPEVAKRFAREARVLSELRHPGIVAYLAHGETETGAPYLAMEWLDGEDLARRLRRVGRLPLPAIVSIVSQVARALTEAHAAGLVHRDLKPANVFLCRDEEGEVVKILDFGVAKQMRPGADTHTRTGALVGTPRYMSPEQARGIKALDRRSDLWSLGVIVYQCATGRVPFMSDALGDLLMQIMNNPLPVPSQIAEVPLGFDAWWARAAAREPEARFQSARELADALAQVASRPAAGGPGAAPHQDPQAHSGASVSQPGSKAVPRSRAPLRVGVAAAVGLGLALLGLGFGRRGPAPALPVSDAAPSVAPPAAPSAPAVASLAPPASATVGPSVEEVRRVHLVVLPIDATVEIDGAKVRVDDDGVVPISGKLGSVHRVRLSKGKAPPLEREVVITETGAMPPKMELNAARPKGPPRPEPVKSFDE